MPTDYTDQFYNLDPFSPPPVGTSVTFVNYTITDRDDDGSIDSDGNLGQRDQVNGSRITQSFPGDTVTINVPGVGDVTYTGVTFYLQNGQVVFTPTDGQVLQDGTFVSSTFVSTQGGVDPVGDLGPPCFTPGTLIATPDGARPVETLEAGDLVLTRDNGPRPIVWTGRRTITGDAAFAPVRIAAGTLGNRRDLLVSPQHRMLVRGWRAELHAGLDEVLVAAAHLVNAVTITREPMPEVTYLHLMLDRHEILFAEGAETESMDPAGDLARRDGEIARLFPELCLMRGAATVRPTVRAFEGRAFAL